MTGQSKTIRQLLDQRLQVVARVSAAQAEYLKQQQIIGGLSFGNLSLDPDAQAQTVDESRNTLQRHESLIAEIEDELRAIDTAIATAQSEEQ